MMSVDCLSCKAHPPDISCIPKRSAPLSSAPLSGKGRILHSMASPVWLHPPVLPLLADCWLTAG